MKSKKHSCAATSLLDDAKAANEELEEQLRYIRAIADRREVVIHELRHRASFLEKLAINVVQAALAPTDKAVS